MPVFFRGLASRLRHHIVTLALLPDTVFHTGLSAVYQVLLPALPSNQGRRSSEIRSYGPQMRFVTELGTCIVLSTDAHTS